MCLYISYPRPIRVILKERFDKLESQFIQTWKNKDCIEYDEWNDLLSNLLSEICYMESFSLRETPAIEYYCDKLSEYAGMIQSTYKI